MGWLSFRRGGRNEFKQYETTNWDSPALQPINGVSLQKYVEVTHALESAPMTSMAAMAELAGVSQGDWRLAQIGWQARLTTSTEVKAAMTKVFDPSIRFRRTYGV